MIDLLCFTHFRKEMLVSLSRDAHLFAERCSSLRREKRFSREKELDLFAKRTVSLCKKNSFSFADPENKGIRQQIQASEIPLI